MSTIEEILDNLSLEDQDVQSPFDREWDADEVIPGVFLGSVFASRNRRILKSKNITHILSVTPETEPAWPNEFNYMVVKAHDVVHQNLIDHFTECNSFIEDGLKEGKVLVHCMAGVSRSATVVIQYVMLKLGVSLLESARLVKSKRPHVSPNEGFVHQLKAFEKMGGRVDTAGEMYLQLSQKFHLRCDVRILRPPPPRALAEERRDSAAVHVHGLEP